MRRDTWATYATYGYTFDAANDQRSAGGVHLHQIRLSNGHWQKRILQSNGRFRAAGPVEPVDAAVGEAHFATAQQLERRSRV